MTILSVNVNKIALLRNSRGRDFPSVRGFAEQCLSLGIKGITVHPRPDERHIRRRDVAELAELISHHEDVEFNIEGYPSRQFLDLVIATRPAQCTLVPDAPGQLTSDHGWNMQSSLGLLEDVIAELKVADIRSSLFIDPVIEEIDLVPEVRADRIELYTEEFAEAFGTLGEDAVFARYFSAAARASELGIGINAGHDLNLANLGRFLQIPNVLEVSIGHALVVECLQHGLPEVIRRNLAITSG